MALPSFLPLEANALPFPGGHFLSASFHPVVDLGRRLPTGRGGRVAGHAAASAAGLLCRHINHRVHVRDTLKIPLRKPPSKLRNKLKQSFVLKHSFNRGVYSTLIMLKTDVYYALEILSVVIWT